MAYWGNEPAKVAVKVGNDVITSVHIEDGQVYTADLQNDAVTATKIDDDGTGFQMGSLGLGTAVSGSHKLTVGGTATFSGAITGTLATASQTNITSVGTIGTGVWQGTPITSAYLNAAQTAITSVGTLTALTIDGLLTVNPRLNSYAEGGILIDAGGDDTIPTLHLKNTTNGLNVVIRLQNGNQDWKIGSSISYGNNFDIKDVTAGTTPFTIAESTGNATFTGTIANTGLHTVTQSADHDGIRFRGYDDSNSYYGKIGITDVGYTQIFAEGNRSIDLKSGRQIRFFTSTDNSTYNNSVNFNSDGSATFSGDVTITGNIIANGNILGDGATELGGGYPSGQGIKRIHMGHAGAEIVFGDVSTTNPLGITEGAWNTFTDTDRLGIYARNELKLYGYNSGASTGTELYVTFVRGLTTFAGGVSLSESTANSYGLNAYHSSGNTSSSAHIIRGDSGSSTKAILEVHEEATRSNLATNVFLVSSTSSDTELFNVKADGNATFTGAVIQGGTGFNLTGSGGRIKINDTSGGDNYIYIGNYNDNGWGYIENFNNSNGLYLYTNQGHFKFDAGSILPYDDNEIDLGSTNRRFGVLHAVTGTINTSDKRHKDNIKTSSLGLEFLNKLNPVQYKWKDYEKFKRAKPEAEEEFTDEVIKHTHKRTHYGLIAQEVEKVLTDSGMTTEDFAPLTYDKDADLYGMRYSEYVGILIKAVQELSAEVEKLKENA